METDLVRFAVERREVIEQKGRAGRMRNSLLIRRSFFYGGFGQDFTSPLQIAPDAPFHLLEKRKALTSVPNEIHSFVGKWLLITKVEVSTGWGFSHRREKNWEARAFALLVLPFSCYLRLGEIFVYGATD